MIAKYKGKEIKDIESIEEIAKAMTYYHGFNEDVEYAIMKSHDNSMTTRFTRQPCKPHICVVT